MNTDEQHILARALLEQNQRWLTAYFVALTGNGSDADDLTQEVFAIALASFSKFDPACNLGAWLRGIARNVFRNFRRKSRRTFVCVNDAALDELDRAASRIESDSLDPHRTAQRLAALGLCLEQLSGRARDVITLKYWQRKASREIAETAGLTVSAVNMLLVRARRALETCISRKMETAP